MRAALRAVRSAAAALLMAAATVLVAGPAGTASADVPPSIPIQYVTSSAWGSVGAPNTITATASCPSGTRVVSSGGGGSALAGIVPNVSFTGATAIGRTDSGGQVQITIGCAPVAQMSEVTSREGQLPAGSGYRRGVVYCPSGMRAFGGGGFIAQGDSGAISSAAFGMTSNAVSADGAGWTFGAYTPTATDRVIIRTQCAPLRGSYVSQTHALTGFSRQAQVYGSCAAGYTALSGGVYLSKPNGSEVSSGYVNWSLPTGANRWYTSGASYGAAANVDKLVALAQCIR